MAALVIPRLPLLDPASQYGEGTRKEIATSLPDLKTTGGEVAYSRGIAVNDCAAEQLRASNKAAASALNQEKKRPSLNFAYSALASFRILRYVLPARRLIRGLLKLSKRIAVEASGHAHLSK